MSLQRVNTGNDIEEALVRISREGYALREAELNVKQLLRHSRCLMIGSTPTLLPSATSSKSR